jgi:transposase
MRAYSQDLRERIARAVAAGRPKTEVARTFSVSVASVTKYVSWQVSARSLAPGKSSGRPQAISPAQYPDLDQQLRAHHDATLAEHVRLWEASHGVRLSVSGMWRTLRRVGWTFKKRQWQPANKTSAPVPLFARGSPR